MYSIESSIQKEYQTIVRKEAEYQKRLEKLPAGSIQKKIISGKEYYYLQRREGKRVLSTYIKSRELEKVKADIQLRKQLSQEIEAIKERKGLMEKLTGRSILNLQIIRSAVLTVIPDYPEIKRISLFGSRAGLYFKDDSDVDLLFESDGPVSLLRQEELRIRLEEELHLEVDLVHGPPEEDSFLEINAEVEIYAA